MKLNKEKRAEQLKKVLLNEHVWKWHNTLGSIGFYLCRNCEEYGTVHGIVMMRKDNREDEEVKPLRNIECDNKKKVVK